MIISDNFLYIRVPRTASSSVEAALKGYHDESYDKTCKLPTTRRKRNSLRKSHVTAKEFKELNEAVWKEKITFAFVRNPYDRIVSYFYYYNLGQRMSFDEFIKTYVFEKKPLNISYWCDQHQWLANKNGKLLVDHVGKFENLNEDLKRICSIIDVPTPELPWLKKSSDKQPYATYYNDTTAGMVRDRCKKDFELFDYKLDLEC